MTASPASERSSPESGDEGPSSSETYLGFAVAEARLRKRCRWAGVVLVASVLLPFEVVRDTPLFVWSILGELNLAAALAALAPALAGLAVLALLRWTRRATALAALVLTTLAVTALVVRIGADAAAWDILPLPDSLTERPISALLAMAAAGGGINLLARPNTRQVGRILVGASAVFALVLYLWPERGETPAGTLLRLLVALPTMPSFRFVLGYGLVVLLLLIPALTVMAAAVVMLRPPRHEPRVLASVVTFALPAFLCVLLFRSLLLTLGDSSLPALAGVAMVLAALLALLSSSAEVLCEFVVARSQRLEGPGWNLRRTLGVAAVCSLLLVIGQWALARPTEKGVAWRVGEPSPTGDRVFGALLPRWNQIRVGREARVDSSQGTVEPAKVEAAEQELLDEARALNAGLGQAMDALLSESKELDLAGRRWFHLVEEVNEASRRAGLPYYVDPTVLIFRGREGLERRFHLSTYRIAEVHPVATDMGPFATLHVRRIFGTRGGHNRILGFSRDVQPFSLVVLDETLAQARRLQQWAAADPPSCDGANDLRAYAMLRRCGELLASIGKTTDLRVAVTRMTERHELQHQIDGPHLPLSKEVLDYMSAYAKSAQNVVNRELSAHVAEMTCAGAPPKLGLVHLVRFTLGGRRGGLYQVGLLGLEALAGRELRGSDDQVCYEAVTGALDELAQLDDSSLRQRARAAWEELFDTDLLEVEGLAK